mgnify:CR=1 FL=1
MSDRLQELNHLIEAERTGYLELISLLEQEQRQLISGTPHKLEAIAQKKAQALQAAGFYIMPVRPPTVPQGSSRLRISLIASIEQAELDQLAALL